MLYDQSFTLAVSECGDWNLSAVKRGNGWDFFVEHRTEWQECGIIGETYSNIIELLVNSVDYITDHPKYGSIFTVDTLLPIVTEMDCYIK